MHKELSGETQGLAGQQIKEIERLYRRRIPKEEIVSQEFARELLSLSEGIGRRIGVLVSREGRIEEVFIGTKTIIYIPDLGRYRYAAGRLRRLRLIYTTLEESPEPPRIATDIYTDLEKLRLDAVAALSRYRSRISLSYAHVVPAEDPDTPAVNSEHFPDLGRVQLDFFEFIEELEDAIARRGRTARALGKPRALLVGVYELSREQAELSMGELRELSATAGIDVAATVIQRRRPDPKTLIGKGKLEEIVLQCLRLDAEMIVFDTELRPGQWRAITNSTELKVIDRSMLILDIFAQRAQSSDGRLQVELAQLKYNLPRLVEKDAGLSRLTGGIGGRGPGETKLEIGRRRIRDRIADLEKRIKNLQRQRDLRRKRRNEAGYPIVAVLGYTNVGKSTLFNALTISDVVSENKLFATLDPTHRRLRFPHDHPGRLERNAPVILSDTVGFIRDLPDELMTAFRATLEELYGADLLLHVLDASDPAVLQRKRSVEDILAEMELLDTPTVVVLNKCDKSSPERVAELMAETGGLPVSALLKSGFEPLYERIVSALNLSEPRSHQSI